MTAQEFRITRTHATWKPRVTAEDIPFFEASGSRDVLMALGGEVASHTSGSGRSLVHELPYASVHVSEVEAERVQLVSMADLPEGVTLNYRIDGGFNNNCIVFSWSIDDPEAYALKWVCVKTFTGMQVKYVTEKKRSPLIFAFADEDAFAYCDKMPCEECAFRCKSGFYAYACISGVGIVKIPIDRVSMISFGKFDD